MKESKKRKKERGRERETETETTSIKLARRGAGNKIAAIKSEACHSRLNGETWKTWRAVKVAEVYPAGVEVAREEEWRKRKREREREREKDEQVGSHNSVQVRQLIIGCAVTLCLSLKVATSLNQSRETPISFNAKIDIRRNYRSKHRERERERKIFLLRTF